MPSIGASVGCASVDGSRVDGACIAMPGVEASVGRACVDGACVGRFPTRTADRKKQTNHDGERSA